MTPQDYLVSLIEAFCASKGLTEREFSEIAIGHPKFMTRVRSEIATLRSLNCAHQFVVRNEATSSAILREQLRLHRKAMAQANAA